MCFATYLVLSENQEGKENYILNMHSKRQYSRGSSKSSHLVKLAYLSDRLSLHKMVRF